MTAHNFFFTLASSLSSTPPTSHRHYVKSRNLKHSKRELRENWVLVGFGQVAVLLNVVSIDLLRVGGDKLLFIPRTNTACVASLDNNPTFGS